MAAKSMELAWIVVKDIKKAIKFYTEVVGLKLKQEDDKFGWAELQGPEGGAHLGLAQEHPEMQLKAGINAFLTFTVDDIVKARADLVKKGARCLGEIEEVPGHVKMQTVVDHDGNHLQLVQKLD